MSAAGVVAAEIVAFGAANAIQSTVLAAIHGEPVPPAFARSIGNTVVEGLTGRLPAQLPLMGIAETAALALHSSPLRQSKNRVRASRLTNIMNPLYSKYGVESSGPEKHLRMVLNYAGKRFVRRERRDAKLEENKIKICKIINNPFMKAAETKY